MNDALGEGLAAEREGRLLDALALARRAVETSPGCADALNLLGRLCAGGGDLAAAIGLQRQALLHVPGHERAQRDLDAALAARPSPAAARTAFDDAAARAPDVTTHHRTPWSLRPFAGIDAVRALLERAIADDPALAEAHAARANVALRDGESADALVRYRRALLLAPDDAQLHLAVAELEYALHGGTNGSANLREALARAHVYPVRRTRAPLGVLLLTAPVPWSEHVLLDLVLDPERIAVHRLYPLGFDPAREPLPPYDCVVVGMRAGEAMRDAIAAAADLVSRLERPVLNRPERIAHCDRPALARTLREVPACTTPAVRRVARAALLAGAELPPFPLLIRPIDTHGGRGLARVDDEAALRAYVATSAESAFDVAPFVDYRSADGWYRKYRVMLVDGEPYPYHLAIAPQWMVHYQTSAMRDHGWMREEERRFQNDPVSVFPAWNEAFGAIAAAIGLDYVGIDCARLPDGEILVFEADPAMLVHALDPDERFAYAGAAVARIGTALERAVASRAC